MSVSWILLAATSLFVEGVTAGLTDENDMPFSKTLKSSNWSERPGYSISGDVTGLSSLF